MALQPRCKLHATGPAQELDALHHAARLLRLTSTLVLLSVSACATWCRAFSS